MDINNSDFTVLIVDDVDANVLLLKLLLTKAGYKTLTAYNGKDALEIIKKSSPDLVLLDIMMPVMDGHEVAAQLREMPERRDMPIIFLSALNSPDDIVKGFKFGAADYVSKPFNKDELLIRVNHQLSLVSAKRIISRQNDELQRTIIGRDKLYSVIAHDLRSPIGSIRMVMNALVLNIPKETLDEDMYELLIMGNRLTEESFVLLDNLLKWTKSQTGRLNTVFQDNVEILPLIRGEVELSEVVAELKNIRIKLNGDTNAKVRIDQDMIKTVLRNLVSNAIKFSNPASEVNVNITEEEGQILISVMDSGEGISQENQDKLFKADSHFTSFGTDNEEGSGLGLLLCKEFVTRNGGKIWFESKEGEGSTFYFNIPTQPK
ncbi:MAG: hybrid sensor histidine kinase/response regulator [Bacteroidales bacterium]|nr:hybrid sensor histidine kinase/response regulator [Bacteroidales bacterium]MDD2280827.1 hybrid sensor histidine kinase/response regulator [Bacteroidales bacterium]MDD4293616.1 hybrid sensor histidine kinase/response regulator [Bacteroidales bacterium]MDD4492153.1 hybrid sensor histidine kinase/response regulator [Bacteroidales bacterium]HNW48727.1 hybrid sensor histidine kinase/response regulator [Bacteroidales bacterium]